MDEDKVIEQREEGADTELITEESSKLEGPIEASDSTPGGEEIVPSLGSLPDALQASASLTTLLSAIAKGVFSFTTLLAGLVSVVIVAVVGGALLRTPELLLVEPGTVPQALQERGVTPGLLARQLSATIVSYDIMRSRSLAAMIASADYSNGQLVSG